MLDAKSRYVGQIKHRIAHLNGQSEHPAQVLRKHALMCLENSSFPDRKNEDYKYTSIQPFVRQDFRLGQCESFDDSLLNEKLCEAYRLIFYNGVFMCEASDTPPDPVKHISLQEALENPDFRDIAQSTADRIRNENVQIFEAIALGLTEDVRMIIVPANVQIEKPIHISHISSGEGEPLASFPYIITVVDQHAQVEILETFEGRGTVGNFTNAVHRLYLADGARVDHYRLQEEHEEQLHTTQTTAYQAQNSTYGQYILELGGKLVRHNVQAIHEGSNIATHLYGAFLAAKSQHIDTQSFIDHAYPHCESNELYKGILTDRSRGVFNGKIIVRQDAQKTEAFQQNSALVLSDHAVMDSKPQLEIFADDVRCSHGATIGQLDQDAVFYLRSRGLPQRHAEGLLQKAFIKEVIDNFPNKTVAGKLSERLDRKLTRNLGIQS